MDIHNKILKLIKEQDLTPKRDKELAKILKISSYDFKEFINILDDLVKDGKLYRSTKNKYGLPKYFDVKIGMLEIAKKGYGFVIVEDEEDDVFIPRNNLNNAMHGDRVAVRVTKKSEDGRKKEGYIVRILKKGNKTIVGDFQRSKGFGFVIADDKKINWDLFIPGSKINGAKDRDKVVAKVEKWPTDDSNPEGKIIEILGDASDPLVTEEAIIRDYEVAQDFPGKVKCEADSFSDTIANKEIKRRKDYRALVTVTIDGEDARDFDDAISINKKDDTYELWVHIADVSYYVKEKSNLDKEALERGTSIYLPDRVIPMLPKNLSNNLCSLKPKVDRLALSIKMVIDSKGKVIDYVIDEAIINSNERMIYEDVADILEGKRSEELSRYDYIKDQFFLMEDLAKKLEDNRRRRGFIDFNLSESKMILDDEGKIKDIVKYERRVSHKIIEEFMLLANEVIAEHFYWLERPFVYRVHENPSEEKINTFKTFIYNLGYTLKGKDGEIHPKAIQELLNEVRGDSKEYIISKMMLRSLKQAKYSPFNEGHFGLATDHYCHFTSPIRRYPDLQIHRIIKKHLKGRLDSSELKRLEKRVEKVSEHASTQERIAEKLERDVRDLKKAEYMADKINEEYTGIISSVTSFGFFVQLENMIEGLVRIEALKDDYYEYDQESLKLIGEISNKEYKIGDEVQVIVKNVNIKYQEIDFVLK